MAVAVSPVDVVFAVLAILALLLGLWLPRTGSERRRSVGLGAGRTVSLDRLVLRSTRLRLVGRPDRIIRDGRSIVIEEWKSSRAVRGSHVAQLGVYFLLAAERFGVEPLHGFIVCGDGSRHRVENTPELRERVLAIAGQIRAARERVADPLPVAPPPAQCRACGQRANCRQSRA